MTTKEMTRQKAGESAPRRRARAGRPPIERAGEVEERILEAAHKVFMERGYDGASIDLIAETARSGKPTIYARYPSKQALFGAAVERRIALKNARLSGFRPSGATIEERLAAIARMIVGETLTPEFIGLYRVTLAEARRFPELVRGLSRLARQRGGETMTLLLAEVTQCQAYEGLTSDGQTRVSVAARYFLDLILLPLMMRALGGEDLDALLAEADGHIARRVGFFLAACRNGGLP